MVTNSSSNTPTAATGKVLQGQGIGTANAFSTATYPSVSGTSGKVLVSDGTNIVSSTPTFPNASATSGKFIRSDGSNWIASTPTLPTAAGTSGNVMTSDGTNFVTSTTRIQTISGDSGSLTGTSVSVFTNSATGATVKFTNTGTTSTLAMVDANDNVMIGRVSGNGSLGSANNNTAVGTGTLQNATSSQDNCAFGFASSNGILGGVQNCSFGRNSLAATQSGNGNCAYGFESLAANTSATGSNSAYGWRSLNNLATGDTNAAFGINAGTSYTTTESSNICILNNGTAGESHVNRIGTQGSGTGQQNLCYIAGITGVTVTGTAVLCATDGKLGTVVSSERYKDNIKDIDQNLSILNLRPVEFNYKADPSSLKQYGLVAEDVHRYFPYLCFYDRENRPESVKYHEIPVLLLMEIQKLNKRIQFLESKMS